MRNGRMKIIAGQGCYYHLINRAAGTRDQMLFNDLDKEYAFQLLENLSRYFLIEVISAAWMGNHFHLVVYAPGTDELPELSEIAARHNAYYASMRKKFTYGPSLPLLDPENLSKCRETALKMIDISMFMRAYQQRFTVVYNKAHKRRGRLWGDRFKSVILERDYSLQTCVTYVELNPVRAGLVDDPADYRFTTWGRERHAFRRNFVKHLKRDIMNRNTADWTEADLYAYIRGEFARIIASERGATSEEIFAAQQAASQKVSMPVRFLQRTRHFTDGAIIGSKLFIREMAMHFEDKSRIEKKQFSRGFSTSGDAIYCFRRLKI